MSACGGARCPLAHRASPVALVPGREVDGCIASRPAAVVVVMNGKETCDRHAAPLAPLGQAHSTSLALTIHHDVRGRGRVGVCRVPQARPHRLATGTTAGHHPHSALDQPLTILECSRQVPIRQQIVFARCHLRTAAPSLPSQQRGVADCCASPCASTHGSCRADAQARGFASKALQSSWLAWEPRGLHVLGTLGWAPLADMQQVSLWHATWATYSPVVVWEQVVLQLGLAKCRRSWELTNLDYDPWADGLRSNPQAPTTWLSGQWVQICTLDLCHNNSDQADDREEPLQLINIRPAAPKFILGVASV
ncbi:uncharacterized protein B0I36DRAFT_348938 [Microdochium trichocladiopsis]|uniref:Uncharacterized protein n=1 Tax=Microdochium trichocladiopsis TaxID=1682393 RepID=A0A9P8Y8I5_9PEZI|nr:uncharacterized protein B0I36DRAFT_348938 [Microdochium trichocladiopsis]KAH7030749.1 hypothetical protein B0I36DRAFT_348938 [Microdochium trichocladiopsis]